MDRETVKKILIPAAVGAGTCALTAAGVFANVFYSPLGRQNNDDHIPAVFQTQEQQARTFALMDRLRARPYETVIILSHDGLRLSGRYYHLADGAPLAILFHGYRGSPVRDFCGGADICFSEGFNVLLVEQRAHKSSEGHTISYGVNERYDVLAWSEYAVRRFGAGVRILLAGISMGAATVLMASALDLPPQVCGILADCPYTSPSEIISEVGRSWKLPMKLLLPLVAFDARLLGGFSLSAADAVSAVREANVPILLIHGEADHFVPCDMSRRIAAANPALIDFNTFPGAGHGVSYLVDTERYTRLVQDFCRRIFL
jgi:hypothetical protein